MNYFISVLSELNIISISIRLFIALLCGGIVGLEREKKSSAAGFKTYILVCLGSCLVMLTGQYLFEHYHTGDIARLGAQVISGIGFLGAGTIIVTGSNRIHGLTTAAGLWVVACLGLSIGSGFYAGTLVAMIFLYLIITLLDYVETNYIRETKNRNLFIEVNSVSDIGMILTFLKEKNFAVHDLQITPGKKKEAPIVVLLAIQASKEFHSDDIIQMLRNLDGVSYIEEY